MKIIGITGGIGSGKSLILKKIINYGFIVYNTDLKAKYLMRHNKKIIQAIKYNFGPDSYLNKKVNINFLSKHVFSSQKKLKILNNIVHPEIEKDFSLFTLYHCHHKFIFKETAILYEQNTSKKYNSIVLITAQDNIRIKRIIQRNQISKKEIFQRMDHQWKEETKINLAKFIIYNNKNIDTLNYEIKYMLNLIKNNIL